MPARTPADNPGEPPTTDLDQLKKDSPASSLRTRPAPPTPPPPPPTPASNDMAPSSAQDTSGCHAAESRASRVPFRRAEHPASPAPPPCAPAQMRHAQQHCLT